jgi:ferritin
MLFHVGGRAISLEVAKTTHDYSSLRSVFEQALEQEISNTQSFNRIIDQWHKEKDYIIINFLQWLLKEQGSRRICRTTKIGTI